MESTDVDLLARMKRSLSKAVKVMMQAQVTTFCGLIQARRDQYLAATRGLSPENVQKLRQAPFLKEPKIFPLGLLKEVNDDTVTTLHARSLFREANLNQKSSSQTSY